MMNKPFTAIAIAMLIGGIASYATFRIMMPPAGAHADTPGLSSDEHSAWAPAAWPFPIDQWGQGWAYQCKAADCGAEVTLYVRPKIGFCNCQTGVADDEELDRVSDLDLLGEERSALAPGEPITVQWMKGRARRYKVAAPSAKSALSLAFNNSCDVIVATVVAGDDPAAHEAAILEFLNGEEMRTWAVVVLGR